MFVLIVSHFVRIGILKHMICNTNKHFENTNSNNKTFVIECLIMFVFKKSFYFTSVYELALVDVRIRQVTYMLPIVSAILCLDQSFTKPIEEPFFFVAKLPIKILAIPNRIMAHPVSIKCKQLIFEKQPGTRYHSTSNSVAHDITLYYNESKKG